MYPLVFEHIYKEMVWGGDRLNLKLGRNCPSGKIGESWDISCRPNEMGIVANGELKGKKFIDVINEDREGYLGSTLSAEDTFPLLVKIIDAKDNLSIQVHPTDEYAREKENYFYGKNEMWYIMDAPENSYLIVGLKDGVTKAKFAELLENSAVDSASFEDSLGKLPIKKGDIINIPAGLVHAITSGVMLAEIQQNSDITYRVYDYGRLGLDGRARELHVEKALDVIDFEGKLSKESAKGLSIEKNGNKITYYIANKYFAIEKHEINTTTEYETDGRKFVIFTCVGGACKIKNDNGFAELKEGDSAFIPAKTGKFTIEGKCELIKSYVPEMQRDVIDVLTNSGYSIEDIKNNF